MKQDATTFKVCYILIYFLKAHHLRARARGRALAHKATSPTLQKGQIDRTCNNQLIMYRDVIKNYDKRKNHHWCTSAQSGVD